MPISTTLWWTWRCFRAEARERIPLSGRSACPPNCRQKRSAVIEPFGAAFASPTSLKACRSRQLRKLAVCRTRAGLTWGGAVAAGCRGPVPCDHRLGCPVTSRHVPQRVSRIKLPGRRLAPRIGAERAGSGHTLLHRERGLRDTFGEYHRSGTLHPMDCDSHSARPRVVGRNPWRAICFRP